MLSSAYLKNTNSLIENALAEENAGQIGIFYLDTKNETTSKIAKRVQFPIQPTKDVASEIILHQVSEKVNLRVQNQTQTKQFMRWFGDWQNSPSDASRIVNSDGTPKVMYHQTDADFSVFRTESTGAGRGDAILPDGAFFKSSDTDIGVSGQKPMHWTITQTAKRLCSIGTKKKPLRCYGEQGSQCPRRPYKYIVAI